MIKDLSKNVALRYAYVKNKVIFNIKTYNNGDSCAVAINETNSPLIKVTIREDDNTVTYYLADYITDGDTYQCSAPQEGTPERCSFKKTIHGLNAEKEITFAEYFRKLCEEEIEKAVLEYDFQTLSANTSYLGVPEWVLTNEDKYEVKGFDTITFDEKYYNSTKSSAVKKLIFDAASNVADKYGYKLTSPSKPDDIQIAIKN